jgi:hypothetical protein
VVAEGKKDNMETKDYNKKEIYLLNLRTIFKTPSSFEERIKRT